MIIYIAIRDFVAFYRKEKRVFIWLIFSMIITSFLLNASYSFAKERGNITKYNSGVFIPAVTIYCNAKVDYSTLDNVVADIKESLLPDINEYVIFTKSKKGLIVEGRDRLTPDMSVFSGIWTEGYLSEIKEESGNECAVDSSVLDYGNRLEMIDEPLELDGYSYTIKGVYEYKTSVDVVIFKDTFRKNFDGFDSISIIFKSTLDDENKTVLENIIKNNIGEADFKYNDEMTDTGDAVEMSNRLQYSIFILLLVVFVAYIIRFWHERNISTYTIYRLNGATAGKIVAIIATEALLLGVSTYVLGLAADALLLLVIHKNLITLESVGFGFALFFVPMFILTVTNAVQLCKGFNITDIRRD